MSDRENSSKFGELQQISAKLLSDFTQKQLSGNLLQAASAHSLLPPGKCFRPALHLGVGELLGLPLEQLASSAIALELIHTATLIHDDLPALDNDILRRGRPTAHAQFGEAAAILTGDRLIALAFQIIAQDERLDAVPRAKLCAGLAEATVELCDGQLLDLQAGGQVQGGPSGDPAVLLEIRHLKKTGALIRAAVLGPLSFLSAADLEEAEPHFSEYAKHLGLLFQVTDDVLDATASREQLGKAVRSDQRREIPTYVSIYGLEVAIDLAAEIARRAAAAIEPLGPRAEMFRWLARYVLERKR